MFCCDKPLRTHTIKHTETRQVISNGVGVCVSVWREGAETENRGGRWVSEEELVRDEEENSTQG